MSSCSFFLCVIILLHLACNEEELQSPKNMGRNLFASWCRKVGEGEGKRKRNDRKRQARVLGPFLGTP